MVACSGCLFSATPAGLMPRVQLLAKGVDFVVAQRLEFAAVAGNVVFRRFGGRVAIIRLPVARAARMVANSRGVTLNSMLLAPVLLA